MAALNKSALMASASSLTYRNDAETEEKKALVEEKKEGSEATADAKADAEAGQKLDRMLSCLDSMSKRMDALEEDEKEDDDDDDDDDDSRKDKRKDSKRRDEDDDKPAFMKDKRKDSKRRDEHDEKIAADKKRGDWDDEKEDDDDEDDDKAKKLAADKSKKDDDEDDEKPAFMKDKKKDSSRSDRRADSELLARLDRLERARDVTDEDRAKMSSIQSRADSAYMMLGDAAPRYMDGEEPLDYRRRLIKKLQTKSSTWKDVDLSRADSAMLDVAEKQIYADAVASAMSPVDLAEGHLRMIRKTDETGRTHVMWAGQPRAWMQQFQPPTRRVTNFETRSNQH